MKSLLLLAALAIPAHAAVYHVCWSPDPLAVARCTEPLDKQRAEAYLARANQEQPRVARWIITESRENDWRTARWASTGLALAAALYDVHTTKQVLAAGGTETNFLYGSHPSDARLYGIGIGTVAGQALLVQWWRHRHPEQSETIDRAGFIAGLGPALVHFVAAVHNESVLHQISNKQAENLH